MAYVGGDKLGRYPLSEEALSYVRMSSAASRPARTRADHRPRAVFLPGNVKVAPVRGPLTRQTYSAPQSTLDLFYVDSVREGLSEGSLARPHPAPMGYTASAPDTAASGEEVGNKPYRTMSAPTQEKLQTLAKALQSATIRDESDSEDDDKVIAHNCEDEASDNDVFVTRYLGSTRAHSRASLGKARQRFFQPFYDGTEEDRSSQNSTRARSAHGLAM